MKIFYISTSTSNALISSLLSDYSAFVIIIGLSQNNLLFNIRCKVDVSI